MNYIPNEAYLSVGSEITQGKKILAEAINAKGGSTSATESFTELAQAVNEIPNFNISGTEWNNGFIPLCTTDLIINLHQIKIFRDQNITNLTWWPFSYTNIQELYLPNIEIISATISNCPILTTIYCPNIKQISSISGCPYINTIFNFPKLERIPDMFLYYSTPKSKDIQYFTPSVTIIYSSSFRGGGHDSLCSNIVVGTLSRFDDNQWTSFNALRNFTVGQDTDINLPLHRWTATKVIAEGSNAIDELNSNLYNNLLTKLYDHS